MPSDKQNLLPAAGLMRLRDFLGPGKFIPLSRSTWWSGVAAGRYPKPIKIGKRAVAWHVEDIRTLIKQGVA